MHASTKESAQFSSVSARFDGNSPGRGNVRRVDAKRYTDHKGGRVIYGRFGLRIKERTPVWLPFREVTFLREPVKFTFSSVRVSLRVYAVAVTQLHIKACDEMNTRCALYSSAANKLPGVLSYRKPRPLAVGPGTRSSYTKTLGSRTSRD